MGGVAILSVASSYGNGVKLRLVWASLAREWVYLFSLERMGPGNWDGIYCDGALCSSSFLLWVKYCHWERRSCSNHIQCPLTFTEWRTSVKPKKGKCHSGTKKTWTQNCYHINITICVSFQGTLLVPGLSFITQVVPEILLILWYVFTLCPLMTSPVLYV